MYFTVDDIKNEISVYYLTHNRNVNKKVGLIRAYFVYSFYVESDESTHLNNGEMLKVKKGCYTMKDMEKVSSGKVKYDSLKGKSAIDPTISQFGPYMNNIVGINNNGNYIDMLLSKKIFSFKINKLSTIDNIFNGKPCDILYTGYLNKDIIW